MKRILILLFFIFHLNSASAQLSGYFNIQKAENGFLVGAEIIEEKTKKVLNPDNFIFHWQFPIFSSELKKAFSNIFLVYSTEYNFQIFSLINLKILDRKNYQTTYEIKNKAQIIVPQVRIVKKINNLTFPIGDSIDLKDKNIFFSVITKNFSSKKLNYYWTFNGVFISNKKEIHIDEIPKNSGMLTIKVSDSNKEVASDNFYINYD